jgi:hypothetical protein
LIDYTVAFLASGSIKAFAIGTRYRAATTDADATLSLTEVTFVLDGITVIIGAITAFGAYRRCITATPLAINTRNRARTTGIGTILGDNFFVYPAITVII